MLTHFNELAEQQLLGSLMVEPKLYDDVSWMQENFFYSPVHSRIYQKITESINIGSAPTPMLLAKHFEGDPDLLIAGGKDYIFNLAGNVLTILNTKQYAQEIYNLHVSRAINALSVKMSEISKDTRTAEEKIQDVESFAFGLRTNRVEEIKPSSICVDEAFKSIEEAQKGFIGIQTGITDLDEKLKGLRPGRLYILAGRPAMGKSALALNIAENAAVKGNNVLFFAQEMQAGQLFQRIIARRSGVPVDRQCGRLNDQDYKAILDTQVGIKSLKIAVDDTTAQTVNSVLSKARKHKRKHGLDLIVIDYLGLMDAVDKRAQMVHQVAEISRGLKNAAVMLGVPIILLSQLNRSVEQREDKRPKLSDLRDSGSIEQDADAVILLYRDEYYKEREKPQREQKDTTQGFNIKMANWEDALSECRGKAEIILAKNRQGRVGTVITKFDGERQEFSDS